MAPRRAEVLVNAQSPLKDRRVLVTGAGGFIGSHLAASLAAAGAQVTALVRYNAQSSSGNLSFVDDAARRSMTIMPGNIEDSDCVRAAAEGMDVVFHLAALISIPYSYVAPRSIVNANVGGTLNVLEAARRGCVGRVILTSTSEVYGTALREPIDEGHPLQAQSPYAASKIAADALGESYRRAFDVDVVTVRPFNTYGPRQSARAFIPTIIAQALWRETIALGALDPRRDMVFVEDTVAAFLAAAVAPEARGATFNVGTGTALSIGDYAARIQRLIGVDKPIVSDPQRLRPAASEVLSLCCNAGRAASVLGWSPRTDLDEGLERTIAFVAAHRGLYAPETFVL